MKIRQLLIMSLLSILLLTGCSSSKPEAAKYSNILSGSFNKENVHSIDDGTGTTAAPIKKIADTQPQETNVKLTQKETKKTILIKLSEIGAGMVSECEYKSQLYFSVDFNNFSLPTKIIDKRGNIFATCDYQVESKYKLIPICDNLEKCKLVYVSENNIRGYNPVDKYSIDKETLK